MPRAFSTTDSLVAPNPPRDLNYSQADFSIKRLADRLRSSAGFLFTVTCV